MSKIIFNEVTSHRHQVINVGPTGSKRKVQRRIFFVNIFDVPEDIPLEPNPRVPREKLNGIYKDVMATLLNEAGELDNIFVLKNKGITIAAEKCNYLGTDHNGKLTITITDGQGIVDGGHTYSVIMEARRKIQEAKNAEDYDGCYDDLKQEVTITVYEGIDELLKDISEGLNTSIQVKTEAIMNLCKSFEWIKDVLFKYNVHSFVAFKQNEPGVEIREIVSIMELFNLEDYPVSTQDSNVHPLKVYSSKGAILQKFANEDKVYQDQNLQLSQTKYGKLKNILPDILFLYDYVRLTGAIYGMAKGPIPKFMTKRNGEVFPFLSIQSELPKQSTSLLGKCSLYPVLAAFRIFVTVDKDGYYQWDRDFEEIVLLWDNGGGTKMVNKIRQSFNNECKTSNNLGKSFNVWESMQQTLLLHSYQMGKH